MAVHLIIVVDCRPAVDSVHCWARRLKLYILYASLRRAPPLAALLPDKSDFEVCLAQSLHHGPRARQTLCVGMRLLDPCLVLSFGGAGASKPLLDEEEDALLTHYWCEQALLAQELLRLDFYTRLCLVRHPRLPACLPSPLSPLCVFDFTPESSLCVALSVYGSFSPSKSLHPPAQFLRSTRAGRGLGGSSADPGVWINDRLQKMLLCQWPSMSASLSRAHSMLPFGPARNVELIYENVSMRAWRRRRRVGPG